MSKCLRFLFILFLGTLHAQDSTPIVSFELTRDNYYENQIKKLKKSINKNNELELFDSISKFAFQYKDWETSIEYLEKLLKTNPTSMRYFLLGGAAGFRALEVSVFSSLKYINIMKPAFEKALDDTVPGFCFPCKIAESVASLRRSKSACFNLGLFKARDRSSKARSR